MATNNNAHTLDTAGNPAVDFVWGNMPLQPNDVRSETAAVNIGGTTGSSQISYKTAAVTAATSSGSGATAIITYTAANSFAVGQQVSITGLTTTAANLSNVLINGLVGSAGAYTGFTVLSTVSVSDTGQTTAVAKVADNVLPGVGADTGWGATTAVTGARLDFAGTSAYSGSNVISNKTVMSRNHELEETGWGGYPAFISATGKYSITQVDGDGTTITYACQNFLSANDSVNITGCGTFNLSGSQTVAKATRDYFTVTNGTTGSLININNGIVERADALTAADGSYVSGVAYIDVPSILGFTTTLGLDALKDAGFATANITNTTGVTNTPVAITATNRTAASAVATITVTGGTTAFPIGTKITIAGLADATNTELNGIWTVLGGSGSTVTITSNATTAIAVASPTGSPTVKGTPLTVKTQSIAAGTASTALSATITMTSWA